MVLVLKDLERLKMFTMKHYKFNTNSAARTKAASDCSLQQEFHSKTFTKFAFKMWVYTLLRTWIFTKYVC